MTKIGTKELGNGLLLRQATADDVEALAEFYTRILYENYGISVRDLLSQPNPMVAVEDFVIVVDSQANDKIAAGAALFSYRWQYAGISFAVGVVEAVGTDPAYRRRGLSRALINAIHTLSSAKGQLVQAVTGRRWYYRQFGYEYALAGNGDIRHRVTDIPTLATDTEETYHVRPATTDDIPTLMALHQQQCKDKLITRVRDQATWYYHINDTSIGSLAVRFHTFLDREQRIVGYFSTWGDEPYGEFIVLEMAVAEGVSFYQLVPMLLRHLKMRLQTNLERFTGDVPSHFTLSLGATHPACKILQPPPVPEHSFVWYMRLSALSAFLQHIGPVLERRLHNSVMSGFNGTLRLSFYRNGVQLNFAQGQLVNVTDWNLAEAENHLENQAEAAFPPLVFLQLLFGYRSLAELRYAFPDCWANHEGTLLLDTIFPKQASWVFY